MAAATLQDYKDPYLMAMYTADTAVEVADRHRGCTPSPSADVVHIVCVDDTNHMLEGICPALSMMEPGQVLWLLEHCHIGLPCMHDTYLLSS